MPAGRVRSLLTTSWMMKAAYALLVSGLIANLLLPIRLFGVAVTSQRLVAALVLAICGYLFVGDRLRWVPLTRGQKAFVSTYMVFLSTAGIRLLLAPEWPPPATMLSGFFNLVLFLLVVVLLNNVDHVDLESLFKGWLPLAVILVTVTALLWWLGEMLSLEQLNLEKFSQAYRMRIGDPRNIVNPWAASLVLVVPLVWRPLLGASGMAWKALSGLAVGATCVAVVLTFSRGALFGLMLVLLVGSGAPLLGFGGNRGPLWRRAARSVVCLIIVVLVMISLVSGLEAAGLPVWTWMVDRVSPVLEGTDLSVTNRLKILDRAWDIAVDAPLLGYTAEDLAQVRHPDNTFLFVVHQHGVLGLVALVGMLIWVGWELISSWARSEGAVDSGWFALFAGYLFLLATNDFLYFSMGSLALATLTTVAGPRGPGQGPAGSHGTLFRAGEAK